MLGGLSCKATVCTTLALASILSVAHGLFPDEAGKIDWYRSQLGVPKTILPYSNGDTTGIYAITHRNVLASLNPNNGDTIWRQTFGDNESIGALQLRDNQALTLSGNSNYNSSAVRVWDTATGGLKWEYVHPPSSAYSPVSGAAAFVDGNKDVVAVVGDSLVRVAADRSEPVWEVALNGTAAYKRVVVQENVVFVIGDAPRTKKNDKPRLHVVEVDVGAGYVVSQYDVADGTSIGSKRLVVIESKEYGAYVVWRDEGNIIWYIHRLGLTKPMWEVFHPKLVQIELTPEDMLTSTITELDVDPGLNEDTPRFALTYKKSDGKEKTVVVEMFRTDDKLDMRKVVGFRSDSGGVVSSFGASAAKVEAKAEDGGALPSRSTACARIADGNISWRIYKDSKNAEHSGEYAYDSSLYGPLSKAVLFYTSAGEARVLVQTTGGLLVVFGPGASEPVWFRDESLAHATDMAFMDLAPPASSAEHAAKATDPSVVSSAVARYILRWVETTRSLCEWVFSGFGLFGSSSASSTKPAALRSVSERIAPSAPLVAGDHFGFRKLSVFGTSTGVVAALSTQDGSRSWTHWVATNGTGVRIEQVFVTRRIQPLSSAAALVTVVGRDIRGRTVVADLDALSGAPVGEESIHSYARGHAKAFALPVVDPASGQQLVAIVSSDADPKLRIWPSTPTAAEAFFSVSDSVFFDLGGKRGSSQIRGYSVERSSEADVAAWNRHSSAATRRQWAFDLPAGETVVSQTDYSSGAQSTALVGRVLGDRSVLYKYINPHLTTVATQRSQDGNSNGGIGIYFVDRVSGRLLYSTVHADAQVSATRPFLAVQTENRVVYQLWQDTIGNATDNAARGFVTVVAELFESDTPDTRDTSETFSSTDLLLPNVVTTAFAAPEPVSALGVTRTGSHITTRDVLFGLRSRKLLALPDQLFDPRRPTRPPTKDEQAEGLAPYAASLPLDSRRVLSHHHQVAGIRHIASAPTHLESTALVAAFGLDLFFTRTSPSGTFDQLAPSFSKVNLVVTTLALVVGCLLGGPMVRRKLTNQAWA
ncbi:hypothetical protein H4S06_000175 [Coemansia sp. BCRC 34490]|nr:hypothetical protein H4S06_000175 [Coemansia sp. BCRC 34490]